VDNPVRGTYTYMENFHIKVTFTERELYVALSVLEYFTFSHKWYLLYGGIFGSEVVSCIGNFYHFL
jgi:hypothetical protein